MTIIDDKWLVSDWDAAQSPLLGWNPDHVRQNPNGSFEVILDKAAPGDNRPFDGGEFQSIAAATTGTWTWMAQVPDMVDGSVFGMFLYQDDYRTQPWREYDIEFVGRNTSRFQIAVHFEDENGHAGLKQRTTVDLGFDASEGMHLYGITVTKKHAVFTVDGIEVATVDAKDIDRGVWDPGPLNSLTDLWIVPTRMENWAGAWDYPGRPLVAHLDAVSLPSDSVRIGGPKGDSLKGTAADDQLYGNGGNDRLNGRGGADIAFGGMGRDTYIVNDAEDQVREYAGQGRDRVNANLSWKLEANVEVLALQGGADLDGTGNGLKNVLLGNSGDNGLSGRGHQDALRGMRGDDRLFGGGGADTLAGGKGHDMLKGGRGDDTFIFRSGDGHDRITDFVAGGKLDHIEIKGHDSYEAIQTGDDTLLVLSAKDSILLIDVTASELTHSDVLFV